MALTLPDILKIEKNAVATKSAWILLAEITLPDTTVLRFARNNEDVIYNGYTWYKLPFEIDPIESQIQGKIPLINIRLSNVTRVVQTYLEAQKGGVGASVKLTVVNSDHLIDVTSSEYSVLDLTFSVLGTVADSKWVTFTLGVPNPLNKLFPLHRYVANHCNWVSRFKGAECGYSGVLTTCKGTLADCRDRSNSDRYGGFIGLDKGGIRFA